MPIYIKIICSIFCMFFFAFAGNSMAATINDAPKKWRIIYVQGGNYIDFAKILFHTATTLAEKKIIHKTPPQNLSNSNTSKPIWDWLVNNANNKHIEFLVDGFYSYDWDENKHKKSEAEILQRIKEKKDVDMILSLGTAAGLDVASNIHNIPTLVLGATDAVDAGIIASEDDSGMEHVYAQIPSDNTHYSLDIFKKIFNFKKLGVPVPKTAEGRALIGFSNVEQSIKNTGFEIVPCELSVIHNPNLSEDFEMCIKELVKKSDAIFFPVIPARRNWAKMNELLKAIIEAGIPSFSQFGHQETQLGVLMSLTRISFAPEGQAAANAMKKIFSGTKPRDIEQVFDSPLGLEINLQMALEIGWHPPFEVLAAMDKVYKKFYTVEELQ